MKAALEAAKAVSTSFSDTLGADVHGALQAQALPVPEVKVAVPTLAAPTDKVNACPHATIRVSEHYTAPISY